MKEWRDKNWSGVDVYAERRKKELKRGGLPSLYLVAEHVALRKLVTRTVQRTDHLV